VTCSNQKEPKQESVELGSDGASAWSEDEEERQKALASNNANDAEHDKPAHPEDEKEKREEKEDVSSQKDSARGRKNSEASWSDIYYFYQSSEGQNIYMHPLHFRCLYKEFGSFEKLPRTIERKIIQLEEITQNEKIRYSKQCHPCNLHVRYLNVTTLP
jgi:hypothetical protein